MCKYKDGVPWCPGCNKSIHACSCQEDNKWENVRRCNTCGKLFESVVNGKLIPQHCIPKRSKKRFENSTEYSRTHSLDKNGALIGGHFPLADDYDYYRHE